MSNFLIDRTLAEPAPIEITAFHFTRRFNEPETSFEWRFNALLGYREEYTHNVYVNPRIKRTLKDFYQFAYGYNVIFIDCASFLRYVKPFVQLLLLVDPLTVVVIDKQTKRFSGAHPQAKRIEDKIRIDQLDIFGLEGGDVVIR